jgi:MFS family permease
LGLNPEVRRIVTARGLRGFADGFVSVLLVAYLDSLGFSPFQIGIIITGTLLGSAALTLTVGLIGHRASVRTLLLGASALMFATGVGFAAVSAFLPMLLVAVVGTLNPSAGDVSVFLPTEQAYLAGHAQAPERPRLYAVYNLAGAMAGAVGALLSAGPAVLARALDRSLESLQRAGFLLYAAIACMVALIYRRLPRERADDAGAIVGRPLGRSRRIVLQLAALFSLDAAAGGLVVQSLLVLWLHLRFGLSATTTGTVFFAVGVLGAFSQLLSARLAVRFGLIRTMVFTHLPANLMLILAAFAPQAWLAVSLLLVRSLFSQMDVPARQAFVMGVVSPEERAAAASVTNVPRSLAAATTPALAGYLLTRSDIGWPLVIAGVGKATYDLLLLALFRSVVPAEDDLSRPEGSPRTPGSPP